MNLSSVNIMNTSPMKAAKIIHTIWKFVTILSLLMVAGCGESSDENSSAESPGLPPSLSNGEASTVVQLTEKQAEDLDIQLYTINPGNVTFSIDAPGQVFAAPERVSVVSAPINGRIARIYVHEGERVAQGDPLLELESLEFANLVADYLEARAEITYQQQQVDRLRVLTKERISPQRTLERAQADLIRAQTTLSASIARLRAVGISQRVIESWDPTTSDPNAQLTIYAPISGILNRHMIELGESVNAYEELLDIIDNTEVLVRGFVSPADAPFIKAGNRLVISERSDESGYGAQTLEAEVTSVNPALDETNRSIVLNAIVATRDGWPIVGQSVRLRYSAAPNGNTISIPLNAVQYEGSDATVFVQRSPFEYVKRPVVIDRLTSDHAIIESGLSEGEKIATTQVFSLKALERFEIFAD